MTADEQYVLDALALWAPTWPRRVTQRQHWATSPQEAVDLLLSIEGDQTNNPYISVYSFPDGHTKEGAVPVVDTLMFDLDVDADGEYRSGKTDMNAWIRDLSALLVRVKKIAKFLIATDNADAWRWSLSGSKGVHAYVDFPALSKNIGTLDQVQAGLESYSEYIVNRLEEGTGISDIHEYVDVDSSSPSRLTRVPNTLHPGATATFGEPRYCVPVSIYELAEITPARYVELTRHPRPVPWGTRRTVSERAHEMISARVRVAPARSSRTTYGSTADTKRVEQYDRTANDSIEIDDIPFLLSSWKCIESFIDRTDAFDHGHESHMMEIFIITHMMERNVPIEVMMEWFAQHPKYDENWTRRQIEEIISRQYDPMRCDSLCKQAERFSCGSSCPWYQAANPSERHR